MDPDRSWRASVRCPATIGSAPHPNEMSGRDNGASTTHGLHKPGSGAVGLHGRLPVAFKVGCRHYPGNPKNRTVRNIT
ncbi:protein of unknown function [Micropruina glycogenica]|uniref:Uncharacterized protein n=1 Tax=Micropruina glycogenica TaxID=75385 RepID=A0A2N9JI76_9ACTN|nr:protein of unknown function [Micropruina glycogenica]